MTTPDPNQQTNPPNPQPPHAATQPDVQPQQPRTPVVVQTTDNGLSERVAEMGRVLQGLPEQIVNGFREATQPAQQPTQQTPVQQVQQGGQNTQAPGTSNNPPTSDTPNQPATSPKDGPKVSRFAAWWYKR